MDEEESGRQRLQEERQNKHCRKREKPYSLGSKEVTASLKKDTMECCSGQESGEMDATNHESESI